MGRSQLTLLLAVAVLLSAGRARAQSAEDKAAAEAAFEEGKRLMEAHAFAEACPKLAESVHRDPGIGAMLGLADCYEKNGQTASAWAEFKEAAAAAGRKADAREALARENAARVEALLSKVLVRVSPEADVQGLVVNRDGVPLARALWEVEVPVDPGAHSISASAPGSKDWQTTVVVPAMPGTQTVSIPRLEAAPPPEAVTATPTVAVEAPQPGNDPRRTQRIVAGAVAGVGVVSAVIGAVLGGVAKSKLDQSNANDHCDTSDRCDLTGLSLRHDAESAATGSTVGFVVAGVAIAGGAVLWFTAPRAASMSTHVGLAAQPAGLSLVGEW